MLIVSACDSGSAIDSALGTSPSPTPTTSGPIGNSALSLTPTNYNFGLVSVGQTSTPLTMVIQNVTGVPIYISSISGTSDPDFSITSMNCPTGSTALAAWASCTAQINFSPLVGSNLQYQVTALFGTQPGDTHLTTNATLTGIGVAQVTFAGLNPVNPANVTTTSVPLTWSAATGASSYTIYMSTNGGSTYTIAQVVGAGVTSWVIPSLTPATTYTFKANAFNGLGQADTNSVTQVATTDSLGSFSVLTALSTSEGGTVTSGDIGLNCIDAKGHYPTFMSISSESDPLAQCVLLTSPYRVQCTPGFKVGAAPWSSSLNISCLLDGWATAYTQTMNVNVAFTDRAPVLASIGNQSVLAGTPITQVSPSASDPNAFTLTYSCQYDTLVDGTVAVSAPNCSTLLNQDASNASFSTTTGVLNWTPPLSASGTSYELKITAADTYGLSASSIFVINVGEPPPDASHSMITVTSSSINSGSSTTVTLHAKDSSGNPIPKGGATVAFSASTGSGVSTGTFSSTTDNGDGTYTATLTGVLAGSSTTIHANAQGVAITSALPTVTVSPGPISVATSLVSISAASVASGSTVTATLTSKDAAGNLITSGGKTVLFGRSGGTSTGIFSATTDNGNGTYNATFTGVTAGTPTTLTSTINGVSVTSTLPTVMVVPGPISLLLSSLAISGSATFVQSGSLVTVTLTTRDGNGNALTSGGQTVTISNSGGTSTGTFGSVTDNGNGTYSATLTGTHAGTATTLSATIGGLAITSTLPTISVTPGSPSVSQSLITVGSATVISGNTTSLTLTTKDSNGNLLTSGGQTIGFSLGTGGSSGTISTVTDNLNGTYSATFTATTSGTATSILGSIGGTPVTSASPTITVSPGPISLAWSLVTSGSPSVASGSSVTLTLQAKDTAGNNLTSGGRTVVFNQNGSGTSRGTFSSVTDNGNGTYSATFTGTTAGTAISISATVDGSQLTSTAATVSVIPANLSLANSLITLSSASLTSGSSITVTLTTKDTSGNQLSSGGLTVAFSHSGGGSSGTFSTVTDNLNGTYTATLTGTTSGSATTITATIGGSAVTSALPTVTVSPGGLSLAQSNVTVSSASVASGSTVALTLFTKDANGNLLSTGGQTIVFSRSGGTSSGTISSVTDNLNGTYSATFTSTTSGSATSITATIGGSSVTSAAPTVTVTPGAISYSQSLVSVSSAAILSGQTSTITLTVKDANGNTMSGGGLSVFFAKSGGGSNGTFGSVTDNSNGTYTATFTGTLSGSATSIVATIGGTSVTSSAPTITVSPGALSLAQSLVTVSSGAVTSGAIVTLTLTTKDSNGNTLTGGGQTVVFGHTGGTSGGTISSTTDNGNGTYTATFTTTNSGSATSITATVGGSAVTGVAPTVTVSPGAISLAQSLITVSSSTVTAGNTVTLTLTTKDSNGNLLTTGGSTVVFAHSSGTSNGTISSTTDNANGTYTATFTATTSGTATSITSTIGGSAVTSASPTITVNIGSLSLSQSLVSVSSSTATAGNTVTLTLTTKDGGGNSLTAGGQTVVFSRSGGTSSGTISATTDNGNGTYTATFTATTSGTATNITATAGGNLVTSTAPTITVSPGTLSLLQSTVTITGNPSFVASGSLVTLKLTTRDGNGNQLTSGGQTALFTASGGTSTGSFSAVTDNGDGTYSATFTGATAGTANSMSATIGGIALTSTAPTLSVVAGSNSLSNSVIAVSPTSIQAGSTSTLTMTVKDSNGNILTSGGQTVAFNFTGGVSTGTISSLTDNHNGTYTATFTGNTSGSATTITGTVGGSAVTSTLPTITVSPGAISLALSPITVSSSAIVSGFTSTLTLTAKDSYSNSLTTGGRTVLFGTTGSGTSAGAIGSTTDHANGIYTATFTGVGAGTAITISATVDGSSITSTPAPTITVSTSSVSPSHSTFTLSSSSLTAGGTATATLVLKDANNNVIADSSQASNLTFSDLATGTSTGTFGAITPVGGSAGSYQSTFTAATAGTTNTIQASLSGSGTFSTTPSFTVQSSSVSASQSLVAVSPSSVTANGTSSSTVTVTLLDAESNPVSGKIVTLSSNRGATDTISAASGSSSASGVVTFTVTSLTAGTSTYTATDTTDSTTLSTTPTVTFLAQTLTYSTNPGVYTLGSAITTNSPTTTGGTPTSYAITPALPAGLSFNTTTGLITGTPTALSNTKNYTITATDSAGAPSVTLPITVNFAGATSITNITGTSMQINWGTPSGASPAPATYSIYKVISGTPVYAASVAAPATSYTVTGLTSATAYNFLVRMTDTSGVTDSNTVNQSATTLSYVATFNGWRNAQALGAKSPAPQATDLTSAPAQVTLNWNAVTLNTGTVASYNIYRATTSGAENYSSPLATGITTAAATYTDTSSLTAGTTYYYTIAPVVSGVVVPVSTYADSEISVIIPPANMALIHPWIANQDICGLMGRTTDRTNSYRCSYTGPENVSGYYNMQVALFVDTYGEGCNYTHGTACSGGDCIGTTGAPAAGVGSNGNVYYDRNSGNCYAKVSGSWVIGNNAGNAQLALMMSNAPGLPPIVNINQSQSWNACQTVTISPYTHANRLLKHSEQIEAAAWSTSLNNTQISNLENGSNLYSTYACNANSGSGLTYSTLAIPTDLNTLPGEGSTGGIYSVRNGSTATTNCVSRYGIQDMVGNVWQWSSDQLGTCSSASHTCQGIKSQLDTTNTDWYGFNFDGTIGPGGVSSTTEGNFSSEALGSATFNSFQVPLGLPMVTSSLSAWDSIAIGSSGGQFPTASFDGNHMWLYTDYGNGSPARGAIAGGSWYDGSHAGRFALNLANTPAHTYDFVGFRCALPAN